MSEITLSRFNGTARNRQGLELKQRLESAGCFAPARHAQVIHMLAVSGGYFGAYAFLLSAPTLPGRAAALLALAFCSVQAGFIAHEAGHGAITRNRRLSMAIGQFFNTFLTALCYSHFQKIHSCHHAHCNERERDIDMQSKLFSLYREAVADKRSAIARFVTRYQAWLIWPLVSLQGFTLKIDSLATLSQSPGKTRIDQVLLLLHLALWFGPPVYLLGFADAALNYLSMTWFIGPYLGTIFLVNHIGTHVVQPGEKKTCLLQRLDTTRNLGDSIVEDFLFGGLNNHIEHHLYPAIPSVRLRRARKVVRDYCQDHRLEYRETSWFGAAREVHAYLGEISRAPIEAGTR